MRFRPAWFAAAGNSQRSVGGRIAGREPVPDRRDLAAVRAPRGWPNRRSPRPPETRRTGARRPALLGVDQVDVGAPGQVRVPDADPTGSDPRAIRAPGGAVSCAGPAVSRRSATVATSTIHRLGWLSSMKPTPLSWYWSRSMRRASRAGGAPGTSRTRRGHRSVADETTHRLAAVGTPGEVVDVLRQPRRAGSPRRLPSAAARPGSRHVPVSPLGSTGRSPAPPAASTAGPVAQEGQRPAVRAPARRRVAPRAQGQPPGVRRPHPRARARARRGTRPCRARSPGALKAMRDPSGERRTSVGVRSEYRSSGRGERGITILRRGLGRWRGLSLVAEDDLGCGEVRLGACGRPGQGHLQGHLRPVIQVAPGPLAVAIVNEQPVGTFVEQGAAI